MPDASRRTLDRYLRRTYGIPIEFYDALLARQDGRCYVCRRKPRKVRLAVDHDHLTGEVRGLLCPRSSKDSAGRDFPACNRIIGVARDNPGFFDRAAEYLRNPPARALREEREEELNQLAVQVAQMSEEYFDVEIDSWGSGPITGQEGVPGGTI